MFTGIVETQGRVCEATPSPAGARLVIDRGGLGGPIARGDSVCVSGVCLTAVEIDDQRLAFDVIGQTLDTTGLGTLAPGDAVNLERAVTASQPLGGHFMQGHVDGLGEVVAVADDPANWRVTVRPPGHLCSCIVPKGSVAIDGVSLTVAAVDTDAGTFDVALIPETLSRTTLGQTRAGDRVHLEGDVLAKTVVGWLERVVTPAAGGGAVTMQTLADAGFALPGGRG